MNSGHVLADTGPPGVPHEGGSSHVPLSLREILDFNWNYSAPRHLMYVDDRNGERNSHVVRDIARLPFHALWHIIWGAQASRHRVPQQRVIFYYDSMNQFHVLSPIQQRVDNSIFVTSNPRLRAGFLTPTGRAVARSLLHIPRLLRYIVDARDDEKSALRAFFRQYLLTFGVHEEFRHFFRKVQPRAVVVANDHVRNSRVVRAVCRELRIPVVFVPHGTIARGCAPPLEFDLALLEGEDSLEKYRESGIGNCTVQLVGRPYFDSSVTTHNRADRLRTLGVCLNWIDDLSAVRSTLTTVRRELPGLRILLRPHPSQTITPAVVGLARELGIPTSDSRVESSLEFMQRVDAVVAGDSGVLLDAAVMNVYPIYFDGDGALRDLCGFVRNGLADHVTDTRQLVELLSRLCENKPTVRDRARRYVATVGTANDGAAALSAARYIEEVAHSSGPENFGTEP